MIHRTFSTELDSPWMTLDVDISYSFSETEGVVELDTAYAYGYEISNWLNQDYIFDLIHEDMEAYK
jgi:hypothetical protein